MIILDFLNSKNLFHFIFYLNLILFTYTVGYYPYQIAIGFIFETFGSMHVIYPISSIILSYVGIGFSTYFISKIVLKKILNKSKFIILLLSLIILGGYWLIQLFFSSIQQI